LRWSQPLIWMTIITYKLCLFNRFKKLYYLAFPILMALFYPPWELRFLYPGYLLMFYCSMWYLFTYLYSRFLLFTEALSYSALIVFVGSFYWEIPAIIIHTFQIGLHIELFYRIFHIIVLLFLLEKVKVPLTKKNIFLIVFGLLVSSTILVFYPDPNYVRWGRWWFWLIDPSPWVHLINRVVCVYVFGRVFMEGLKSG